MGDHEEPRPYAGPQERVAEELGDRSESSQD